jgi:HK97 gp10 family phage protein
MDVKLSLTGDKEIDNLLKGLPDQFNHRVMQAAHAEAAKPLLYREHLLAPVGRTGKLAESIGIIKTPFAKANVVGEIQVGPRRGRFGGHAAHLIEFGTVDRQTKKSHPIFGIERGRMTPKPFIEPAFLQTIDQVINGISTALAKMTLSFMKRTIRNG